MNSYHPHFSQSLNVSCWKTVGAYSVALNLHRIFLCPRNMSRCHYRLCFDIIPASTLQNLALENILLRNGSSNISGVGRQTN